MIDSALTSWTSSPVLRVLTGGPVYAPAASGDTGVRKVASGDQAGGAGCSCGAPDGRCQCTSKSDAAAKGKGEGPEGLTEEEKAEVEQLKKRDREVRAHEQAHAAAAGPLAQGGPQYEFTTGPDGKQYATGGHVKIDTSPGRTPEETKKKAEQIKAAALAPSDPSGQDMQVAAKAAQMKIQAEKEEAQEGGEDEDGPNSSSASASPVNAFIASLYQAEKALPGFYLSVSA